MEILAQSYYLRLDWQRAQWLYLDSDKKWISQAIWNERVKALNIISTFWCARTSWARYFWPLHISTWIQCGRVGNGKRISHYPYFHAPARNEILLLNISTWWCCCCRCCCLHNLYFNLWEITLYRKFAHLSWWKLE